MNNKLFLILALPLFLVSVFGFSLYLLSNSKASFAPNSELSKCNTLVYNSEDAINLVFFASKSETKKYYEHLTGVAPFNKNKDNFNVYFIDSSPDCEIYKGIALLCDSRTVVREASSCPNDYIIVVKKESPNIRSSSYTNIMSLNSVHPLSVIIHEFGHSFANFAEEYTPANLPRGAVNCVPACKDFGDIRDGCYEGCSKTTYLRSVDSGVMRTLATDNYGVFNIAFLEKRLKEETKKDFSFLTGNAVKEKRECKREQYYMIQGEYNSSNNSFSIKNKSIEQGCVGGNGYGNFSYSLFDNSHNILLDDSFNPEFLFTDVPIKENTELTGETFVGKDFIIKIPKTNKASELEINHYDKKTSIQLNEIGSTLCKI